MTKVVQLLDELEGKGSPDPERFGDGYDKRVYSRCLSKEKRNTLINQLCSKLQKVDVSKYSLEMQIWWRDHKRQDKERLEREMKKRKTDLEKQNALNKLTRYEKELLGVD